MAIMRKMRPTVRFLTTSDDAIFAGSVEIEQLLNEGYTMYVSEAFPLERL